MVPLFGAHKPLPSHQLGSIRQKKKAEVGKSGGTRGHYCPSLTLTQFLGDSGHNLHWKPIYHNPMETLKGAIGPELTLCSRHLTSSALEERHLHTHVYCGTIHNSQVMETVKMPHH
jgi:hypothetical protein